MAELADALDPKIQCPQGRAGSTPAAGIVELRNVVNLRLLFLLLFLAIIVIQIFRLGKCREVCLFYRFIKTSVFEKILKKT